MVKDLVTRGGRGRRAAAALMVGAGLLSAPPAGGTVSLVERPAASLPAEQVLSCPAKDDRPEDHPAPTRASVRELVKDFVRAYNEGDFVRLEEVFAREQDFMWYFVQGERVKEKAKERHTLLPYFAERHLLNDRFRLLTLSVRREKGWHGGYDFFVRLRRDSDEQRARGAWHGKGAADCAIFVWSIGKE